MKNEVVLRIENVSKMYRLGEMGTGTISHDLNRWWHKIRGKEDPYSQIAQQNDRRKTSTSEYIWAVKDINFEVEKGEVIGIIGRNGAGKSTLLKILSQLTLPTKGDIKSKGRIASLLEVGTGMHPEMTAKENIYLNGAILGMTKKEINEKFDEIVDFSGCKMYVDTPLKRFSSGMRVRLGFAVAAFLEPEILIVDEVLAVGDAEFQKKAIGKMKEISKGGGRTVLFVSHNMISVKALCTKAVLMDNGQVVSIGEVDGIINQYMALNAESVKPEFIYDENVIIGNDQARLLSMNVSSKNITVKDSFYIELEILNTSDFTGLSIALDFVNNQEIIVFGSGFSFDAATNTTKKVRCIIPADLVNDGVYSVNLYVSSDTKQSLFSVNSVISFEVMDIKRELGYLGKINGVVRPNLAWEIN